jgi:xylulose-5-phosphate/fructose-6-phosphate phosphoketolase
VLNELDRFHLVGAAIDLLPQLGASAAYVKQALRDRLLEHHDYIREHGDDLPAIRDWTWSDGGRKRPAAKRRKRGADTAADGV